MIGQEMTPARLPCYRHAVLQPAMHMPAVFQNRAAVNRTHALYKKSYVYILIYLGYDTVVCFSTFSLAS